MAAFKKALEMDPFFAVASFQRGVSHFGLGELHQAYEDFNAAYTVRFFLIPIITIILSKT